MTKQFWLNLPVKDIVRSKEFFSALGFSFNPQHGNTENSACLLIGEKNAVVMLYDEATFKDLIGRDIGNTDISTEVLFSIDTESKEEVDEMIEKVIAAGGTSNHRPTEMKGWMYGCIFTDLDGHRWNILYMDTSKIGL